MKLIFKPIGFKVSDPLAGFRVIRKKDWERLDLKNNDLGIETEMNIKVVEKGLKVKEVLIPHFKRAGGLIDSKTVFHPHAWFKIFNPLFRYIKKRLKNKKIEV
jgi:hypothetical protein